MPSETCLITGGSGLIGQALTKQLRLRGHEVRILTRSENLASQPGYYHWSVHNRTLDTEALKDADHIIHLAGAGIASKRWTPKRKLTILNSRVDGLRFLFEMVQKEKSRPRTLVSASGVNYYGTKTTNHIFSETDPPAGDFLGKTCVEWEQSAMAFQDLNIRTVMMRTPMVLSADGGALPKLMLPVKLGLSTPIGNGRQYMPWIHINDLCHSYVKAIEDPSMSGPYNANAPEQPTNKEFMKIAAKTIQRPFWHLNIPGFFLRLILGEMAGVILEGSRVSNSKLVASGFQFKYLDLSSALKEIYASKSK